HGALHSLPTRRSSDLAVLAQHRSTGPGHEQGRRVSRPRGALARGHQATGIEPGKAGNARGAWCAPSRRSHCRCGPEPLWRYLAFDAPDHLRDTVKTNRDRLRAPKGLTQTTALIELDTCACWCRLENG